MPHLEYTPLEPLAVPRPVRRVAYVAAQCRGKAVLDLGCYDETALLKRGTHHWLHGEIARVARSVLGVDNSDAIGPEGVVTGPSSRIVRGDASDLERLVRGVEVEVIVAGELIEHLPNTVAFLAELRRLFPGRALLATTPNATSLTNLLLGAVRRENNHRDHLQVYSFKTLNTVCRRVGFASWTIVPYYIYYTEMGLRSGPIVRPLVRAAETVVNGGEFLFPLLAGGLILHVDRM
ncbi:MAG TPA: methyltransferase domain-containing protein [Chloroflexota bacterium]|jgi:hypothetical protein